MPRVILASKSPARLATLRAAGVSPLVIDAAVDESGVEGTTQQAVLALARRKGEAALELVNSELALRPLGSEPTVLIAADTLFDLRGRTLGKPGSDEVARQRLAELNGAEGKLYTGHYVAVLRADAPVVTDLRAAVTVVRFARMDDAEMDAYAASGEPAQVAGSFTIDGLGGPFIEGVEGDPHNVVGLCLPLLRLMLRGLGVPWTSLWTTGR